MAKVHKGKGVPTNQGKVVRHGTPKTIDIGGKCDGGGSAELARAAKSINSPKKGGLPGL
jgi:hypothetical protein